MYRFTILLVLPPSPPADRLVPPPPSIAPQRARKGTRLEPLPGVDCIFTNSYMIVFFFVDDICVIYDKRNESYVDIFEAKLGYARTATSTKSLLDIK